MSHGRSLFFSFLLAALVSSQAHGEAVTVAVASNFTSAMTAIAAAFHKKTGQQVTLAFGSSGKLLAQIAHGAPFDLFFSADQAKPRALVHQDLAIADSEFTYAVGALALWSATPGRVDDQGNILGQGNYQKLALANPRLAPYGEAAMEVLRALGLVEQTRAKWVQGENIAQTYQFVATGNADIGFVALSQVMKNGHLTGGSGWIVPESLYSPIRQDAVLLKRGENNELARSFLAFIHSDTASRIIRSYGYSVTARSE